MTQTTTRTEQPVNAASIPASVGVPLLRALVFLAFDGIAAGAVAGVLKKAAMPVVTAGIGDWLMMAVVNAVHPISIGAIAGVMSARFHWQRELAESNATLWRIEEVTKTDLDGDGIVGPPPAPATKEQQLRERLLPVHNAPRPRTERERFESFVRGCQHNTAQNYWEGEPRNMLRDEYIHFRDILIKLGWAKWRSDNSNNQGWELLFTPEEIIAGAFRRAPSPTASTTTQEGV